MSQPTIFLRPPPNVPFVQGFPGIGPSLPQRPQAAVKGTIELRIGSQGVKAKWLRVELRKIEVLPGGGASNTYFDFVGQSPISLWQAQDEWNPIFTQDFPFYIRVPESIPPSITLEKSAGIKYELIATLAMKGKRGFFRRSTITSITTTEPVIIDKHDIHSTWPTYSQPESQNVTSDALTLTVDRTQSCFGPGDRVPLIASLHSNNLSTVVLKAFEYTLKEVIIYRAGSHISSKNNVPQVKTTIIGEQKVPVNATLYGGTQHKLELSTFIPKTHTSTTIKTARHIDITYTTIIKAVLASGRSISIDLPIIVSNWTRNASIEAVKRIGPVSGLSLDAATESRDSATSEDEEFDEFNDKSLRHNYRLNGRDRSSSNDSRSRPDAFVSTQHGEMRNGILKGLTTASLNRNVDEHGYTSPGGIAQTQKAQPVTFAGRSSAVSNASAVVGRRANSISYIGIGSRLTVANSIVENEEPQGGLITRPSTAVQRSSTENWQSQASLTRTSTDVARSSNNRPTAVQTTHIKTDKTRWLTAEEEKQRLFDQARADAERVQSSMGNDAFAQATVRRQAAHVDAGPILGPESQVMLDNQAWLSIEEEKMRLYEDAQSRARQSQAQAALSPLNSIAGHGYSLSMTSLDTISTPPMPMNTLHAIPTAVHPNASNIHLVAPVTLINPSNDLNRLYPTAENEKAALRYYEAKLAVDRRQGDSMDGIDHFSPPEELISYDTLYPSNSSATGSQGMIDPSSGVGQSTFSLQQQNTDTNNYMTPIPIKNSTIDARSLGNLLQYEARSRNIDGPYIPDVQQAENISSTYHPQRQLPSPRTQPMAPSVAGARPITAAEEKERLRAQYESEDGIAAPNMHVSHTSRGSAAFPSTQNISQTGDYYENMNSLGTIYVPPPPPLMPRPPAEYIQETEEQDMRHRDDNFISEGSNPNPNLFMKQYTAEPESSHLDFISVRHPYALAGGDVNFNTNISPPPLPPKIPLVE